MLQVASFALPEQQEKANEFLKTHKPVGNINFNKDTIVVFYENDPAADLVELLESVSNAKFQQEVALYMAKRDIAGLNRVKNKAKFDELDNAIRNIQEAIDDQDAKAEYLNKRIEEKRSAN
jgi:DNA gyrase/topoisomerase IV subunit A